MFCLAAIWRRPLQVVSFDLFCLFQEFFLFHLVHNIELRAMAAAKGAVNRYHHNKRAEQ